MKYTTKITLAKSTVEEGINRATIEVTGTELSDNASDYTTEEFKTLVRIAGAQLKIGPIQAFILADIQSGREKPLKDQELADAWKAYNDPVDMKDVLMGKLKTRSTSGLASLKARLWAAIDADDMALAKSLKAEIAALEASKKAKADKPKPVDDMTQAEATAELAKLEAEANKVVLH